MAPKLQYVKTHRDIKLQYSKVTLEQRNKTERKYIRTPVNNYVVLEPITILWKSVNGLR